MIDEGDRAPAFELPSTSGGDVSLGAMLDRGTLVLLFNRGAWCSYCAEQLQTFSHLEYDLWRNHDTNVLGISGDPVPAHRQMQDRFDLSVPLLSDRALDASEAWVGIEENDAHGDIPYAATFVVDPDGVVQYAHHADDASDRTYANYVRHFISGGYEEPYARAET
jgi:peroxiredoxin